MRVATLDEHMTNLLADMEEFPELHKRLTDWVSDELNGDKEGSWYVMLQLLQHIKVLGLEWEYDQVNYWKDRWVDANFFNFNNP